MKYSFIMGLFTIFSSIIAMEKPESDSSNIYDLIRSNIKQGKDCQGVIDFIKKEGIEKPVNVMSDYGCIATNWLHIIATYGCQEYEFQHGNYYHSLNEELLPFMKEIIINNYFREMRFEIFNNYAFLDTLRKPSMCPEKKVFENHTIPFCLLTRGYAVAASKLLSAGFYLMPYECNYLLNEGKTADWVLSRGRAVPGGRTA